MKTRPAPRTRRQRGFTILEIVIVFILLAGIMAFVGPKIFEQMGRAKSQEARIRIQDLAGRIEMYKLEVGKYPDNLQSLVKQPPGWTSGTAPTPRTRTSRTRGATTTATTSPGRARASTSSRWAPMARKAARARTGT